jgi:hypothetical protein
MENGIPPLYRVEDMSANVCQILYGRRDMTDMGCVKEPQVVGECFRI